MHLIFPANSCSSAFKASRLSPKMSRLSKKSLPPARNVAWQDFAGSSMRMRGSSLGWFSLPIHVSSSLVLWFAMTFLLQHGQPGPRGLVPLHPASRLVGDGQFEQRRFDQRLYEAFT